MHVSARKSAVNIAFAIALAIFVAIGWLAYLNMAAVKQSDALVLHTHGVIHELDLLLVALADAETGQRGYIITGNEKYLSPYRKAAARISAELATLRNLTKDNRPQQRRLDSIEALSAEKLAELQDTIEVRRSRGLQAAAHLVLIHLSSNKMEELRKLVVEVQDREQQLLLDRSARKESDIARTLQAVKSGGAVGLAMLLVAILVLNREIAQRSGAEAVLIIKNQELQSTRDRERGQDWVRTGINELNTLLRGDRELSEMAGDALAFICRFLQAGVGALYLYQQDAQSLRIVADYALAGGGTPRENIRLGEGAAGEAARERQPISLHDLPADYLLIASALGEAKPRSLLALPLLHDARLIAVLELASFKEFSDLDLTFLNQSGEVLAIAIGVNQSRLQVNELLQQSQTQEEELRLQQEELQQSNDELEERARLLEQQREQIQVKNRELEAAGREISQKARELEQTSNYKSQFLANMSHELRTPLNSLMILSGHLQDNRDGNLTAKQVEYAATIKSAGNDLLNLVNDILDLSKIEAGRLQFVYEDAFPAELCSQLAGIFAPMAEQKGVELGIAVEEGIPEKIRLDCQRTMQVLKNLLANAVKFTQEGSIHLRVYIPQPGENPLVAPALAFAVADTGIGIAAAKRELVFRAFQQADGTTSRRFGGTGLGLSISRQLARGMHGEILLSGAEGEGSVFTLYLPLSQPTGAASLPQLPEGQSGDPLSPQPEGEVSRPLPSPPERQSSGPLPPQPKPEAPSIAAVAPSAAAVAPVDDRDRLIQGKPCILIVEDDPVFADLLMERVRERGFSAVAAADGDSGLTLADRLVPSAILLDVLLPGRLDGWGVMQQLNDNPRLRLIPVHVISCPDERHKALSMGAVGFVSKPATGEQLDAALATVERTVTRPLGQLLVVEDDPSQAAALVALLQERNLSITVAETGALAVELLAGSEFDCLVLDLGLADMSGFDLLEQIRSLEHNRRLPVIVHTGRELTVEEVQRLQHYAQSIIIKGGKSSERLLNEVTLFLHLMESQLPEDKRRLIRKTLDTETLLAGKKVLLVDDDMRNIFSLSSVLIDKGMRIVEAENGQVALKRLEEHPDVDLVLMDVMMPEMDGYQATRLIRSDPRFAGLPIIALTAKAMKGDRDACLRAGASDYLTKPVDLERLLSLLRVWLYNRGGEGEQS